MGFAPPANPSDAEFSEHNHDDDSPEPCSESNFRMPHASDTMALAGRGTVHCAHLRPPKASSMYHVTVVLPKCSDPSQSECAIAETLRISVLLVTQYSSFGIRDPRAGRCERQDRFRTVDPIA